MRHRRRPGAPRSAPPPRRASSTWRTASSSARRRATPPACCAELWQRRHRHDASTCSARRRSPAAEADRYAARCRDALDGLAEVYRRLARAPAARARRAGPLPRANLSVKVSALTPLLRPDAPELGKRDAAGAPARAAAPRARARRAPAHRHGVARLARGGHRARARAARRGRVPRRPVGRASCSRPTCATRPSCSSASSPGPARTPRAPPAHGPARQGRLLGPRGRRGAPARLARRRCSRSRPTRDRNFEALTRRLLEARAGACASPIASPQPALGRARHRRQPRARRRTTATSSCRCCAAWATTSQRRARRARPARAHLLPGRRPRGRHGLPRAPPAREHHQRVLPAEQASGAPLDELLARAMTELPTVRQRAGRSSCAARRCASELAAGSRARRARCRCACRSGSAASARDGRRARLDRPGRPRARRRAAAAATERRGRRGAVEAAAARASPSWRATPGRRARRGPRRGRGAAARAPRSSSPRSRCASAPSRGPRPTPTSARRSTSSSTTRAARSRSTAAARCFQVPGERNEMHYAPARRRRRDRAVELPARDPDGDDRRRRSPPATPSSSSRPSSRRAARSWSSRRCARPACPPDALALLPGEGEAGAALVRHPRRAHDRLHRLGPVGLEIIRAAAEPGASATSSAWSPRWAARTA